MKTYYAVVDGFIHDRERKKGAEIRMTERQAKYLLLSGLITEDAPKKEDPIKRSEPDPATLERKTR
jgi:hypothetical protein